jgi:excinuclease ABC subunit C
MTDPGIVHTDPEPDVRSGGSARRGAPPASSPRGLAVRLPHAPGVYRFRDAAGRVLYVGRAVSLRRRVVSYWGDLGDRAHLSPMVDRIARLEAVVCDSAHEAAWLERNLLQACLPPWNLSRSGGQEVAVWIRLSESAYRPGVAIVHQPSPGARHFGPYLGGRKVRRAVSGLCRVVPLEYAGTAPVGARRELARLLGVSAAEPGGLAQTVAAVLDRDPAAVAWLRERLLARRDAAATRLAFEFAARLQEEIEALDWVTAEQKVTRASPADFDVHGWADGMLVRFAVRGGRLTDWTQRSCDAAPARGRSSTTPPEWTGFAQRNAELAARLAA